jgi:hypothetical protein
MPDGNKFINVGALVLTPLYHGGNRMWSSVGRRTRANIVVSNGDPLVQKAKLEMI